MEGRRVGAACRCPRADRAGAAACRAATQDPAVRRAAAQPHRDSGGCGEGAGGASLTAPALLLFKALACGLLFLLYRNHQHRVVAPALGFLAGVYCVLSLVPWLIKFGGILANAL